MPCKKKKKGGGEGGGRRKRKRKKRKKPNCKKHFNKSWLEFGSGPQNLCTEVINFLLPAYLSFSTGPPAAPQGGRCACCSICSVCTDM